MLYPRVMADTGDSSRSCRQDDDRARLAAAAHRGDAVAQVELAERLAGRAGDPNAVADGGLAHPVPRWPGPVSLGQVDWQTAGDRCDARPRLASRRLRRATVNDATQGEVMHPMRANSSISFPATDSDPLLQQINGT